MSYENINLLYNKFCRGPLPGSLCSVSFSNPSRPSLNILSQTGGIIQSFDILGGLDRNMLLSFEYVGPDKLDYIINDSFFYTLEKINKSRCLFKIFKFDTVFGNLSLFHQKIFSDFGNYSFDVNSMCVEYHSTTFSKHSDRWVDSIYLNNVDRLREGDVIFVGPSNDPEYVGKYDVVKVEYIIRSEKRVFITPTIQNQYIIGDRVTFSPSYYFFNNTGISGDTSTGSVLRIDTRTDAIINRDTKKIYQRVKGAVWSSFLNCIGMLFDSNIIFCNPYNYYINVRSMFLNNFERFKRDFYNIYDIVFMDDVCFKLSDTVTYKDDSGEFHTYYWEKDKVKYYNFQRQTMIPFVNTLSMSCGNSYLPGYNRYTTLNLKAVDQFGVGLRDVNLLCNIESGGQQSRLNPLSGHAETDINGNATMGFITHSGNDEATIRVRTIEGSSYSGSVNVFARTTIWNEVDYGGNKGSIRQIPNFVSCNQPTINNPSNYVLKQAFRLNAHYYEPVMWLDLHSFFTSPGGNWLPAWSTRKNSNILRSRINIDKYLWFLQGTGGQHGLNVFDDGDSMGFEIGKRVEGSFNTAPTKGLSPGSIPRYICNRLTTTLRNNVKTYLLTGKEVCSHHIQPPTIRSRDYDSTTWWFDLKDPWVDWFDDSFFDPDGSFYSKSIIIPNYPLPRKSVHTKEEKNDMRMSQLYHSLHTYFVDGVFSEHMLTHVRIDQFIFVQDARPAFYSHKNPVFTDIWLRLRPFASSLNAETLRMRIRKVSRFNDSGIVDITDQLRIEAFDAGSSLEGLEVTYDPEELFEYNSIVYVYLEVYDFAGNLIKIDYWFTLIHDYRIPYILNMSPNRLESGVDPNTTVYFEVRDDETGIDIDSLAVTVNTKVVFPQRVDKLSDNHYIIEYTPPIPFMYGTSVDIGVFVGDRAFQKNWLRDGYNFYIVSSASVGLIGFEPRPCIHGVNRYYDVSFIAIDLGAGVDKSKLRLQVSEIDLTNNQNTNILPIIYRVL